MILAPVYYRCPLLCNQLLNGLTRSLKPLSLDAGKDFDVVAFSINPEETPELAARKKAAYLERYDRPGTESGWHFLTGDAGVDRGPDPRRSGSATRTTRETKLYAHAAGVVIVTPDGRIARYFYGIDFPPKELQSELERAQAGRIGSPIGRLLLALLRLRRGHRQVHAVDPAADPGPRDGDGRRAGGLPVRDVPPRAEGSVA